MRDRFEAELTAAVPDLVIAGRSAPRLPHVSNVAFVGLNRQALLMALDLAGVSCSTGSACASGSSDPSPTLAAMGCAREVLDSALRFSWGISNQAHEVDLAVRRILTVYKDLRKTGVR
jgi:cysteine desulfurase